MEGLCHWGTLQCFAEVEGLCCGCTLQCFAEVEGLCHECTNCCILQRLRVCRQTAAARREGWCWRWLVSTLMTLTVLHVFSLMEKSAVCKNPSLPLPSCVKHQPLLLLPLLYTQVSHRVSYWGIFTRMSKVTVVFSFMWTFTFLTGEQSPSLKINLHFIYRC